MSEPASEWVCVSTAKKKWATIAEDGSKPRLLCTKKIIFSFRCLKPPKRMWANVVALLFIYLFCFFFQKTKKEFSTFFICLISNTARSPIEIEWNGVCVFILWCAKILYPFLFRPCRIILFSPPSNQCTPRKLHAEFHFAIVVELFFINFFIAAD